MQVFAVCWPLLSSINICFLIPPPHILFFSKRRHCSLSRHTKPFVSILGVLYYFKYFSIVSYLARLRWRHVSRTPFDMKIGLTTLLLTLSGLCNAVNMCEFTHVGGLEIFRIGTSDGFVKNPAGCSYSFVCEAAGCSFSNLHPAGCVSSCHLQ